MIRRYELSDIPQMLKTIETFLAASPTYRGIVFDRTKVIEMLVRNENRKAFFCNLAFDGDQLIGGLCAETCEYSFSKEVFGAELIFYIIESKRSLRAATELVASYVKWGQERRLREIRLASTTGIKTEKFGLLCERLGFKALGSIYSMEI